jgi:cytochrome c553
VNPAGVAERGKVLAATCLACHGAAVIKLGSPPVPVPKILHQRQTSLFYAMHDYRTGTRKDAVMGPLMSGMSDQDYRDLAAYIGAVPVADAALSELTSKSNAGRTIAASTCAFCHGERGLTVMDGYPVLAGQYELSLRQALLDYKNGTRADPTMQVIARQLSAAQIDAVAAHYASQSGLGTMQ